MWISSTTPAEDPVVRGGGREGPAMNTFLVDERLELCLSKIVTLPTLPDVCAGVLSRCSAAHPETHELCHIFRWENWGLMKLSNLTLSAPLVSGKGA